MSHHIGETNKMVSETPRMDASAYDEGAIWETGCDIERELNAASKERDDALMMLGMYRMKSDEQKQRIKRLEEALDLVRPHCDSVHHSKKHQHQYGEPCPVVALIENVKEAKP